MAPVASDRKLCGFYASTFILSLLFKVQKVVVVAVVVVVVVVVYSSSSSSSGESTGKGIPVQVWAGPYSFRRSRLPEFLDS